MISFIASYLLSKRGRIKKAFPALLQDKTFSEQIFDNWIFLYQITIMQKNP